MIRYLLIGWAISLGIALLFSVEQHAALTYCKNERAGLAQEIGLQNAAIKNQVDQEEKLQNDLDKVQHEQNIKRREAVNQINNETYLIPQDCLNAIAYGAEKGAVLNAAY